MQKEFAIMQENELKIFNSFNVSFKENLRLLVG